MDRRRSARPAPPSDDANAALAAWQRGEVAAAEAICRDCLRRRPADTQAARLLGIIAYRAGRYEEALSQWRCVANGAAADASDHSNLGAALRVMGQPAQAEQAYRRAIECERGFAAAHYNLGNLLADADRLNEAAGAFRTALDHRAEYAEASHGLGLVMQRLGQLAEAVTEFRNAARLAPRWAEAWTNLGVALLGQDQFQDAEAALHQALALKPAHAPAHGNLSAVQLRAGRAIAAETASRAAIRHAPTEERWHTNLAMALQMQGRHDEAEVCYRRALALKPDYATGHGNLLFALNYRTDLSAEAIFDEYRAWDERHARPLAPAAPNFDLDRTAGRRLRVGYVSADFRTHAAALFSEPLLAAHDRKRVELFCYAEVAVPDATTARFRTIADHWRSTVGMSDAALAELIRADRIDVLVDLAGHTAGNRLLVFARRPAPVQVAYLLGHGYSTGLTAMDAFLADAALAPAGCEHLFSERLVRLPRIPLAYAPPAGMPPVAALPALAKGKITFGHFGRPERLNEGVIAAWASILRGVPGSRLVLNSRPFEEAAFSELFAARFAAHGIARDRLDLICTAPQTKTWAAYGGIDIALDPFPHNAGTTTIEALWQGVPVVTLAGRPSVGRFGASILGAVGLDDWVTRDEAEYVARAIAAASDVGQLAALRAGLRARVAASPLRDAEGLARAIETAYEVLWDQWREGDVATLHRLFGAGDLDAARSLAERMLARDAADVEATHVLGLIAYREGLFPEADRYLIAAIASAPQRAELHANHAAILRSLGRFADAEVAARAAIALNPKGAESHSNLGNILRDVGRHDEAVACFETAVAVAPRFADAWSNMAWVLALAGQAHRSETAARQAIACDPGHANAHNNLGLALMRQSRLEEAEAVLRQAVALRPDFALPHSNILFCLNYRRDLSAEAIFAEYRNWDVRHARPLAPTSENFDLDRTPGRRLRVGYVSPDFRTHAAAFFAEGLLAAHDRKQIEVYCYAEVTVADATTDRFRALAGHWRTTVGLSDAALAEQIRTDRIDVLVDLAGHTAGNRLLVFARRPAPVQVEYLVGHGYSSGLSAMDAFLADAMLAPAGSEHLFSERLVRLPRIPLAYTPPAEMPPVAVLPALANGFLTFGHFGRPVRLNDGVIAAWARILHAVPGSRLMLNSAPFAEPAGREMFAARFAAHGIERDRLELIFSTPQTKTWAAYDMIDIALDPFPHNAGTTTIEALWQGVPVVTLAGRPSVGRFGASILHAVGLDDWVTEDEQAYVARAVAAASDVDALARLRGGLRRRAATSPLLDAAGLARYVETAFRTLWDEWRARDAARGSADARALHQAGVAAFARGDMAAAELALTRAVAVRPSAATLSDLGVVLRGSGRLAEAEAVYRHALEIDPTLAAALGNLGNVLCDMRRFDEAETVLAEALRRAPDAVLLRSMALCLLAQARPGRAEEMLRRALELAPADAEAHETLGALLGQTGRPIEAETHHRAALPGQRTPHRTLSNLAIALLMQGRYGEAEVCCRHALALKPDYATGHGNLLFALNYRTDLSAEAIFDEYRAWDERHARPLAPAAPNFDLDRTPGRRLRVGYVSADFRTHAAALFSEPLLAAHDRKRVELFCYAEVAVPDATTARFRTIADHWRSTVGMSDAALAELIRADRIDVLVDLAGHTAGNRLLVFARRAAPVQVAYLLGHGYSTGLTAMDAFLADAALAPAGCEHLFSERLVRLPRIPLAYAPPAGMPPVAALPALTTGKITYGHFGRPERLNEGVIAAWASILRDVPGSRLVLNSRPFEEAAFAELFAARFAAHGIARDRLDLVCTSPQTKTWAAYGGIDIALDPFPHNAGTTTIEALWQGVPVVTLAGRPSVGRFGASILGAVGLDDWVTHDEAEYVARAIAAASDVGQVAALRAGLRARVAASPLRDAEGLARAVEDAYQALWEQWLNGAELSIRSGDSTTVPASCTNDVAACAVPN